MSDTFLPGSGFDTYESQDKVLMQMDGSRECAVAVRILQQQGFAVAAAVVRLADTPEEHAAAEAAKALAKKMSDMTVEIAVRAGENGRLFGKVTNQEVADALKAKYGMEVDKRKISIDTIKEGGDAEAVVKLYPEVSAKLKLKIVPQA